MTDWEHDLLEALSALPGPDGGGGMTVWEIAAMKGWSHKQAYIRLNKLWREGKIAVSFKPIETMGGYSKNVPAYRPKKEANP